MLKIPLETNEAKLTQKLHTLNSLKMINSLLRLDDFDQPHGGRACPEASSKPVVTHIPQIIRIGREKAKSPADDVKEVQESIERFVRLPEVLRGDVATEVYF